MSLVVAGLSVASFVLLVAVGYAWHDGFSHHRLAKIEAVAGMAGFLVSAILSAEESSEAALDCSIGEFVEFDAETGRAVYEKDCPELGDQSAPEFLFGLLSEEVLKPTLVAGLLAVVAVGIGWLIAQITSRKPQDERSFFPPDDDAP